MTLNDLIHDLESIRKEYGGDIKIVDGNFNPCDVYVDMADGNKAVSIDIDIY